MGGGVSQLILDVAIPATSFASFVIVVPFRVWVTGARRLLRGRVVELGSSSGAVVASIRSFLGVVSQSRKQTRHSARMPHLSIGEEGDRQLLASPELGRFLQRLIRAHFRFI